MKNAASDDTLWSDDPTPEEALAKAVTEGNVDLIGELLAQGADANGREPCGYPIVFSAYKEKVLELLLSRGADINARGGENGITALHFEARGEVADWRWVKVLLAHGADANACDKNGSAPLFSAQCGNHAKIIDVLVDHGANVNARGCLDWTPLHDAASMGHVECAVALLRNGANPNARCIVGKTPLVSAVFEGEPCVDVARELIEAGACVNTKDDAGFSPLEYAMVFGYTAMVKLLVSAGADIGACLPEGLTPLAYAVGRGHTEMAEFLREHGAK